MQRIDRFIHYVLCFTFYIILFTIACLWMPQGASATGTQQLYDKAVLYKEMYQAALEVGRDYCLSKREGEVVSRYFPLYLGILYSEMGEWERAILNFKKFERLPDLRPEDRALSRIRRGMALYQSGETGKAKTIWRAEIRRNEKNPKIRSAIGYAYGRFGLQLNEALKLCRLSLEESSHHHFIKRNLGWVYLKQGNVQKAQELLESIDLGVPNFVEKQDDRVYEFYDPAVLLHLSYLYFKIVSRATAPKEQLLVALSSYELGEYEAAIERFRQLANQKNQAEMIKARLRLGACYYKLDQPDKASKIWTDLRRDIPNNKDMLTELGIVYSSLNINPQEAESLCTKALPSSPEKRVRVTPANYRYYRNLGWVYLNNGKSEEAVNLLSQTRNPEAFNNVQENGSLFFLHLANSYYHVKNFNEALLIYGALAEEDKAGIQIYEMAKLISIVKRKQLYGIGVSRR